MIYFNIVLSALCIWIIMWLNHAYLRSAMVNKYRFKLFSLRDDLALLAMRGGISEEDKDYRLLLKLLNHSIGALDEFRVFSFLRLMSRIVNDKELQEKIEKFRNNLNKNKNEELASIARNYFEVNYKAFLLHTKFLRTTLLPVGACIASVMYVLIKLFKSDSKENIVNSINKKKEEYDVIDSRLDELRNLQFAYA